ncbi:MAG: HPr family phosphocarrier protein [Magnetococcales bacterium]|nr:HPr family phosphocarrier protein [Magnetococcales bacterium]
MPERQVTIVNRLGMHARASAKFVMAASRFKSEVWISKVNGDTRVDGKSIMGIMMLAAAKGDKVLIGTEGEDAQAALDTLSALIGKKFGEEGKTK